MGVVKNQTMQIFLAYTLFLTRKSLSEALFLASINPQYDNRLFMELPVQYMENNKRRTWAEHVLAMFCPCSALAIFMCCTGNSMNNLLSYCGLIDAKIRASGKDLPVDSF